MSTTDEWRFAERVEWEIWFQDHFDPDGKRKIETNGRGLINGLIELWLRFLWESLHPATGSTFSAFNLWDATYGRMIKIEGNEKGLFKIRRWVFDEDPTDPKANQKYPDKDLLHNLARAHLKLLMDAKSSVKIADLACDSISKEDFIFKIVQLNAAIEKHKAI